jgi:hypothetical protein
LLPEFDHLAALEGPVEWVRFIMSASHNSEKRRKVGCLFSFWWNIWKERKRRVFDGVEKSVPQLATLIQDGIAAFSFACA